MVTWRSKRWARLLPYHPRPTAPKIPGGLGGAEKLRGTQTLLLHGRALRRGQASEEMAVWGGQKPSTGFPTSAKTSMP